MSTTSITRGLVLLLAFTLAMLAWNHFGMERRLELVDPQRFGAAPVDDRTIEGGRSEARLSRVGGDWQLDCRIALAYQYPFCELGLMLGEVPNGLDLSSFDSMHMDVEAAGPEPQPQVRILVQNFDPAYSKSGQPTTYKTHEVAFAPARYPQGVEVPLTRFAVASWWIDEHPLPLELSGPDLRNVMSVSLATGGKVLAGDYRFRLRSVVLIGKWIDPARLRLGLIAVWMLAALAYLLLMARQARRRLRQSMERQLTLWKLNASLRSETRTLAQAALRDQLTGVLNRKGMDEALRALDAQPAEAAAMAIALIFVDIDHFKRINDEHGHAVGDQVIHALAQLIRQHVQRDDLVTRWGGEEFVLVLPNTDRAAALQVAHRLRELVPAHAWPLGLKVTCSFGVTEWQRPEPLADALERADAAMYRAKREGRDRVVAEPTIES
ncbi:GGDEF domain-containing protein [Aquincola sp. S2]|uniref:diguanylate cyclase n=1 Tax=Pseudaquabacterium terrae TaxID=2732868 RepID=A0ABX2ELW2_9BURK|nr:GGDEF domain-containing protein [Aquabacterium terrae]NRF69584.1 GGDEF domain-containing protein [Aquabacterium terrae]